MIYKDANVNDILPAIREVLKGERTEKEIASNTYGEMQKIPALKRGLLLKGITGCGKTHTLYAIRTVVSKWGQTSNIENWVNLLFELKKDNFARVNSIIDNILSKDYIFIDDIGAEKMSEWSEDMLYLIINQAYVNEKKLFVSTNLDDEQFTNKYGNRIASRLGEMCVEIKMPKKDWRLK